VCDQEAATKQIGRLVPLSTSPFNRDSKPFLQAAKLTFLDKILLVTFELTSLLRLDASPLTLSINRHSFSQQIEK
jgi:hypothetical protein